MTIRWYRVAVFALWLAAMSWLTVRKVLPPFFTGERPAYESAGDKPQFPVGWILHWNGTRMGWALSEINKQADVTTVIHSLVHFDKLPIEEILPVYLRDMARPAIEASRSTEMEVDSVIITNTALKQLNSFESKLRPKGGKSPLNNIVSIVGNVEGDKLKIGIRAGDWTPDFELPLPKSDVRDNFGPEMELPNLHLGQWWTIESYSPLTLSYNPMDVIRQKPPTEILYAKVEEQVSQSWNDQVERMWVVVYRSDPGEGPGSEKNIRNRLWVTREGAVVKQEVYLGEKRLLFTRMSDQEAARLLEEHKDFQRQRVAAKQ